MFGLDRHGEWRGRRHAAARRDRVVPSEAAGADQWSRGGRDDSQG